MLDEFVVLTSYYRWYAVGLPQDARRNSFANDSAALGLK
jgi:hypothetical protein